MAMGYEGLVRVKVDATEDVALANGASVPNNRVRMESSSGYGGNIKTPVSEIGLGSPRNYDWVQFDGSIDLELTEDFWTNQIKAWIFDRQKAATINLQSRAGNVQAFSTCYWNSISLSASEGSVVTSSIGFVALGRDTYTIGGNYIGNKTGDGIFCTSPAYNVPSPLNIDSNTVPIPYWNTQIELDGLLVDFITWNLDFSQDVVKFFSCEVNANPQEPRFVAVGPMTASFRGDYMFVGSADFLVPNSVSTLDVTLGSTTMSMGDLELTSDDDAVQSQDSMTPIVVDYSIYELVS